MKITDRSDGTLSIDITWSGSGVVPAFVVRQTVDCPYSMGVSPQFLQNAVTKAMDQAIDDAEDAREKYEAIAEMSEKAGVDIHELLGRYGVDSPAHLIAAMAQAIDTPSARPSGALNPLKPRRPKNG